MGFVFRSRTLARSPLTRLKPFWSSKWTITEYGGPSRRDASRRRFAWSFVSHRTRLGGKSTAGGSAFTPIFLRQTFMVLMSHGSCLYVAYRARLCVSPNLFGEGGVPSVLSVW